MTGIGEGHDPMTNITGGDALDIHIFVADHSGIKSARANLSGVLFEPADDVEAASCTKTDIFEVNTTGIKVYDCYWTTGAVKEGYLKGLSINFTFEDFTNHTSTYQLKDIEVLGRNASNVTRWNMYVTSYSPLQGIDRMVWGLRSYLMHYRVNIERTGNALPLSITMDPTTCSGLDWVGVDEISGKYKIKRLGMGELVLNSPDSLSEGMTTAQDLVLLGTNPGAVPEMWTTDEYGNNVSVKNVTVTCYYYIQSIVTEAGEKHLSKPEEVNITFVIPVYNNDLGNVYGNLQDKIKDEEDYVMNGWNKFAYYLRLILDFAKQLCSMVETLMSLLSIFGQIADLFKTAGCAVEKTGVGTAAGQTFKTAGAATAA
jgi:hypothetical protein